MSITLQEAEHFLTLDVRNGIITHMMEDREIEACGMITLSSSGQYLYERAKNVSKSPEEHFEFNKKTRNRIMVDDAVIAYVHTHPRGPTIPSKRDMEVQIAVGKPSVIGCCDPTNGMVDVFSFGDHLLDVDMDNRQFRYGVFDCYEDIRGWMWQNQKVKLGQYPRHDDWWSVGAHEPDKLVENEDMYSKFFEQEGYRQFTPNMKRPDDPLHPRVGDAILLQIAAPVINHAAVYIGGNLIHHHRVGKKSGASPLGYLTDMGYVRAWLRREEQ